MKDLTIKVKEVYHDAAGNSYIAVGFGTLSKGDMYVDMNDKAKKSTTNGPIKRILLKRTRWRAERYQPFYCILSTSMDPVEYIDTYTEYFDDIHARGNYFKTLEEATEYRNKITELLLNRE